VIPVYISSKGKFNGDTPTTSLLKAGAREYKIFVETAYQKHHKDVVPLEKRGQRIGYARREIQRYADRNEVEASWILDDDLKAFYRIPDRKGEPSVNGGAALLHEAEESIPNVILNLEPLVAAFHLDFHSAADRARNPDQFTFNKIPVMNILVLWERVRKAKAEYDPGIWIHEDVDFAFQLFKAHHQTAQFNRFSFRAAPGTTSATHPDYLAMSLKIQQKHPGWCQNVLQRNDKKWKKHLGV
jgi:hypothetical protein